MLNPINILTSIVSDDPSKSMSLQSDPFTATHPSMSKTTTLFDIPPHYLLLMPIGQGSYGLVYSAFNLLTLQIVAVKKIANALENISDARKVLREIAILKKIKHPNIIALKEVSMASEHSKDVYMYYELMDTDLKKLIRWKAISNDYIQYFVYQVRRQIQKHLYVIIFYYILYRV